MTVNGILQITLYFIVLILLAKPLGSYMARVYQGERTFLHRIIAPVEQLTYRLAGVRSRSRDELEGLCDCHAGVQPGRAWWRFTCSSGCRGYFPSIPRGCSPSPPISLSILRSASSPTPTGRLWRRDHHELPDPDAGTDRAELRLGCHRNGDPGRLHPRPRAPLGKNDGQFLGGYDPQHPVHPAAASTISWRWRSSRRE